MKHLLHQAGKIFRGLLLLLFSVGVFILLMNKFYPITLTPANHISSVITDTHGTWLYASTNQEQKWRFGVNLSKLDPLYLDMLLAFEDQRFWQHWGMDPLAMSRAVWQLIKHRHITSGGSTITMQLARLLEPKPRTVRSKIIEIIRAFQLESTYTKEEILQAYLTLAPYGGNIEGLEGASMRYFAKPPYSLTPAEAALLVSLPQSPESNRPDRHPSRSRNERNKVLGVALEKGIITPTLYRHAIQSPLPKKRYPYPRLAPHLSQKILRTSEAVASKTTLDYNLQHQIEQWAKQQGETLSKGSTLSLLIVHNPTAEVKAYLGSHDMFSPKVAGFIDMTHISRSPGSVLKPFIYALGFEKHLVHPKTLILDRETRFGDYLPHNYSGKYQGEVSISYALRHSLNIPAVKLLDRLGVSDFMQRIDRFDPNIKIPQKHATLPVGLGGLGMSIWDITQLYVALANNGRSQKIHLRPDKHNRVQPVILFTPEAAQMTTEILRSIPPPKGHHNLASLVAYKTGTSYGYRDLWTIAYTPEYTVTLWVGRPDNATQPRHSALELAAPLAFEVIEMLQAFSPLKSWDWHTGKLYGKAPTALQYFDAKQTHTAQTLRILHPKEGERYRSAGCHNAVVGLSAQGGKFPYHWYLDGAPLPTDTVMGTLHLTEGAHTVSLIDTEGIRLSHTVWVERPDCAL